MNRKQKLKVLGLDPNMSPMNFFLLLAEEATTPNDKEDFLSLAERAEQVGDFSSKTIASMDKEERHLELAEQIEMDLKLTRSSRFWQSYERNLKIDENNILPIGLVKAYDAKRNRKIIEILNQKIVFPHYCSSLYGCPSEQEEISKSSKQPEIYRSEQYDNVGKSSFVKSWDDFMMYIGWPETITQDIKILVSLSKQSTYLWNGHDMITDLNFLFGEDSVLKDKFMATVQEVNSCYSDIESADSYPSFVAKSANIITSIQLSSDTHRNIQDSDNQGLIPVCQIHFGWAYWYLEREFGVDVNNSIKASFRGRELPIYAVTPPIYAHKSGAFYDSQTNMIIGKRNQIVEFLLFLNQQKLLDEKDLRYLV